MRVEPGQAGVDVAGAGQQIGNLCLGVGVPIICAGQFCGQVQRFGHPVEGLEIGDHGLVPVAHGQ